ncbi:MULTISPECIES: rhodanese family protein [Stenotrophomonas]|uniref:Rhodanese family protein n=1 Tax=Stenotrophomonas lactitubi TaxID=2045214 RepID=A0AAW4GK51_9GAMM|nr:MULTISPECIES: rhodanese family protein [Stenotrophomonas]MBM9914560.1 rhodanese family protein [Stenotrophomonas lactitubi]MBM9922819.1 rhodanese family protein [Stenotrophomonas lactitubi]MBM9938689.1 rhodanese family protein [Stenotrophomonas lactitubi]
MSLKSISPQAASELLGRGAVLVDIRAADEHARERIATARHVPMESLRSGDLQLDGAPAVIFHCRSGNRTRVNSPALGASTACEAYVLEGGLDAWKKAGLPVVVDASHPIELQRQVQIAAGSLIVLGAVLGATVSPWFHALSGFVGAGLLFAGVSGFCGLARVLMRMPWNRKATQPST